jgi:hypothetical protein
MHIKSPETCQTAWQNEIVACSPSVCQMLRACIASLDTSSLLADHPPCLCPAVALLEGAGCDTRRRAGSIRSVLRRERRAHLGW